MPDAQEKPDMPGTYRKGGAGAMNERESDAEIFTMTESKAPGASGKKKGSGGLMEALRALFQK